MTKNQHLRKVNSATKYPSIPTYHKPGKNGLLEDGNVDFSGTSVVATEKIDGTNCRIIVFPDGFYLIGSREELLTAKNDIIYNPMLGIVDTVEDSADIISDHLYLTEERREILGHPFKSSFIVFYCEVYGGENIAKSSKQYTSENRSGFRVFDIAEIKLSDLDMKLEEFSSWRDRGGQNFFNESALTDTCMKLGLDVTPRIPLESPPPSEIEETHEWLKATLPRSLATLDIKAPGRPEGLVLRTPDRHLIAKARFENYERHKRKMQNS